MAFDRPDTRLKATAAAAAAELFVNVTVAQTGDERHKEALELLQEVWSDSAGSLCQEVKLRAGDVLLADNSVLLSPCLSTVNSGSGGGGGSTASAGESVQITLYDELHALKCCALDRQQPNRTDGLPLSNEEQGGPGAGRGHMLWLGLQIDSKNLKWWWW